MTVSYAVIGSEWLRQYCIVSVAYLVFATGCKKELFCALMPYSFPENTLKPPRHMGWGSGWNRNALPEFVGKCGFVDVKLTGAAR